MKNWKEKDQSTYRLAKQGGTSWIWKIQKKQDMAQQDKALAKFFFDKDLPSYNSCVYVIAL